MQAGVSIATVSRVVSGRGPASQETRARVLEAVALLGYSPSAPARSLRTTRTHLIAVLVPNLVNPVFVPFLRGVQHEAQLAGYSVLVVDSQRSAEIEAAAVGRLVELRVEALILVGRLHDPAGITDLADRGVVVATAGLPGTGSPAVIDELETPGTRQMCAALASLGHRHVLYATGGRVPGDTGGGRLATLGTHCDALGMQVSHMALRRGRDPHEAGRALRARLASGRPGSPTVLVCASFPLAPTLLAGLDAASIDVPAACSFVTYGDSDWAAAYRPPVSVVTMDLYKMAVAVARQTLQAVAAGGSNHTISLADTDAEPARFVRRASVGVAAHAL